MKFSKSLLVLVIIFALSSCDLYELDINVDPNNPRQVSPELLLSEVETSGMFAVVGNFNPATSGFMVQSTSSDDFEFNAQSWNGTWNSFYTGPLKDVEELILLSSVDKNEDGKADLPNYLGIAKVLKAYYFSVLVDMWGDLPYFDAFKGNAADQVKQPVFDNDEEIYADLIVQLDEAITLLGLPAPTVRGDLIYNGNLTKWKKAANSLKLKLYLQSRLAGDYKDEIQALMSNQASLITSPSDDFLFQFSSSISPDYRHPQYAMSGAQYGGGYFAHQFMFELLNNQDPRLPFYLKRQSKTVLDPADATQKQTIPCSQRTDCIYGYFPSSNYVTSRVFGKAPADLTTAEKEYLAGFFGRDRSDPSGVPDDAGFRTAHGLYPIGGLYDDTPETANNNKGKGDGIFPIATSWMVKFWEIEAMLTLGVTGPDDVENLFAAAMIEQFSKVNSFSSKDPGAVAMSSDDVVQYIENWLIVFENAPSLSAKLAVALKQAWFCNYGNGIELYNTFRRTGLPGDLQRPLQLSNEFALSLPYTQDEINLNPNVPIKTYFDPSSGSVFWDKLKFQFN